MKESKKAQVKLIWYEHIYAHKIKSDATQTNKEKGEKSHKVWKETTFNAEQMQWSKIKQN